MERVGRGGRTRAVRACAGVVALVLGLGAASCGGDGGGGGEPAPGSSTLVTVPSSAAEVQDGATTIADDVDASTTTAAPEPLCPPDTTTTTAPPTSTPSTVLPSPCDLIDDLPPEDVPDDVSQVTTWDGTISGSVQPVGCTPVSQSGEIILVVLEDGVVFGAGYTRSGAYSCDNGAEIDEAVNAYGIDGTMTDRFVLTFSDGVQLTSGPIQDGHAEVVQDTGFGVVTIELECRDC